MGLLYVLEWAQSMDITHAIFEVDAQQVAHGIMNVICGEYFRIWDINLSL
jgi:hypothetical protein